MQLITEVELYEVSLVKHPANPYCRIIGIGGTIVNDMEIGSWVKRRGGKWHLVDSTISGAAVTRCGRRLEVTIRRGLDVSEVMPLTRAIGQPQLCKGGCDTGETGE